MDNRRRFEKIEFYITNVCNLTCDNCNRFNNYKFSGWQNWNDYKDHYKFWSTKLKFDHITILGGEPLLNPTICDWVRGINLLWETPVQILTNGTRLNQVKGLYDVLTRTAVGGNWIGVSLHNVDEFAGFEKEVYKFLKGRITKIDKSGDESSKFAKFYYEYVDTNNARISVYCQDTFVNASLFETQPGKFGLHNNDPVQAHSVCGFAKHKNYHFIKGKFYKCGPVALLPEFDQQFAIELLEEDRALLSAYQPLTPDTYDLCSEDFFNNLDNHLPQCKFCPTQFTAKKIFPISKEFSLEK